MKKDLTGKGVAFLAAAIGTDKEKIQVRLLCAELKYHEADLEKEIDYPVSPETEHLWKENLLRNMGGLPSVGGGPFHPDAADW